MKVLVVEYFTGGGWCGRSFPDLYEEGELMLLTLIDDLSRVAGVRPIITRDARLPPLTIAGVDVHVIAETQDWMLRLSGLIASADAFWPIAPETDRVLEKLCALCERSDCLLLNSSTEAVRCTSSKYLTAKALEDAGLPCIKTWKPDDDWRRWVAPDAALVIKPDVGVGCEGLRIASASAPGEFRDGDVIQPYIEGQAISLSVLYGGGEYRLAALNLQEIERRNAGLALKACVVNGVRRRRYDFDALVKCIGCAITGLAGYVGIDCIMQGDDLQILEINPRLTTSYAGLHRSLGVNPAACVLSLLTQTSLPPVDIESATAVRVEL